MSAANARSRRSNRFMPRINGTRKRKTKGIEVKTMIDNDNDKITMRKGAVEKKTAWMRRNHASVHTVVVDDRDKFGNKNFSGHRLYYRRGFGSFRLVNMIKVESPEHLKRLLSR